MESYFAHLPKEAKLNMWREMCLARALELRIRQCVQEDVVKIALISLWEEGLVGTSFALDPAKDWIAQGHRSKSPLIHFGLTPEEDLANHMCKAESIMHGREANIHYGIPERHILHFVSHMLSNWPAGVGIAKGLQYRYLELERERHENEALPVVLCYGGDGASAQGTFREVIRYAAAWNLPMGFIIDNNGLATDTTYAEETAALHLSDFAHGENMIGEYIEADNVVAVYNASARLIARAREVAREPIEKLRRRGDRPAPFILECNLASRIPEHNETRPAQCVDPYDWIESRARDPIEIFRTILLGIRDVETLKKITSLEPDKWFKLEKREFTAEELLHIEEDAKRMVEEGYTKACAMANPKPDETLLRVFPPLPSELQILIKHRPDIEPFNAFHADDPRAKESAEPLLTNLRALRKVLNEEAEANPKILQFGQDVGGRLIEGKVRGGGVFGATTDVLISPKVGRTRVWNTPLAEIPIVGTAIGLSLVGLTPIGEIQYLPFATVAASQLIEYLNTWYWSIRTPVHAILRMPCGGGTGSGEYHSSMRLEAAFYHALGLKMVHPSTPNDIVGLMKGAIRDNAPIIFFENIWGYTNVKGAISGEVIPVGPAALRKRGDHLTVAAWGAKTWFDAVLPAVAELERDGTSIELIDLRTLAPLAYGLEMIVESLRKTGLLLIVHEDIKKGGIGESIAQQITSACFDDLLAPPEIVAGQECFLPQQKALEEWFLPSPKKVLIAAQKLLANR